MTWITVGGSRSSAMWYVPVLTNGAPGQAPSPRGRRQFRARKATVEVSRSWGGIAGDRIVGGQTWSVSLRAVSSTSDTAVGPNFVVI